MANVAAAVPAAASFEAARPAMSSFDNIDKLQADLWEAADNLRANSKLTSTAPSSRSRRHTDRATVEATFAQLVELMVSLDDEQTRAAREGLNEDELALFDLLGKDDIGKAELERVMQASRELLRSLQALLSPRPAWPRNTGTQAEVKVFILDELWRSLPRPPFTEEETECLPSASMVSCGSVLR